MSGDRRPRRRDGVPLTEEDLKRAEMRARAWRAAFDGFPGLRVGTGSNPDHRIHPCPWLVWAISNLSRDGGELKRGMVLAERAKVMRQMRNYDEGDNA